jgi:hypothetical protein
MNSNGLTIPQGGDLQLEEENNPVKQYEFSKLISFTADSIRFGDYKRTDITGISSASIDRNTMMTKEATYFNRW